jgi:hypothetical protein
VEHFETGCSIDHPLFFRPYPFVTRASSLKPHASCLPIAYFLEWPDLTTILNLQYIPIVHCPNF